MLAFSTTVPLLEIAFAVLLLPYLLLATLAFSQRPGKPNPSAPVFLGPEHLLLAAHIVGRFLVGAALPALYILDGLRSGDTTGIAAESEREGGGRATPGSGEQMGGGRRREPGRRSGLAAPSGDEGI